jgi:expansin (peptidoglycan-binding protein)
MVKLQYFNGKKWIDCGEFHNERIAWISLGSDNLNYRTIDENGAVLTDKSVK